MSSAATRFDTIEIHVYLERPVDLDTATREANAIREQLDLLGDGRRFEWRDAREKFHAKVVDIRGEDEFDASE